MSRILVVEDEAIIAKDLQRLLERLGHEVAEPVARGEDAVEAARRLRPDLVVMDVHLAGKMDGVEAARSIRETTDAAIVFLTAFADVGTLERAKDAVPYAYLVKPFDEETLRTTVAMALHKRQSDLEADRWSRLQSEALDQIREGVVLVDGSGSIAYANPAARSMLPLAADDHELRALWHRIGAAGGKPVPIQLAEKEYNAASHRLEGHTIVVIARQLDALTKAAAEALAYYKKLEPYRDDPARRPASTRIF